MKRRQFIKRGALFVPMIFVPRLIRAQVQLGNARLSNAQLGITNAAASGNGLLANLIAYWRCEDSDNADWADATGNGHTLTKHGNLLQTPLTAKHLLGRQVSTSTYGDSASTDFLRTGSWTLSIWGRTASAIDGEVLASEFGTGHNWFIFGPGGGVFEFGMRKADDSGNIVAVSAASFTTGVYNHTVVGWDAALQQIWIQVNNEPRTGAAIVSYTDTPRTDSENFTINGFSGGGSGIDGSSNNGGIDEIGYWTRSLSTADVTNLQTLFYDDFTN